MPFLVTTAFKRRRFETTLILHFKTYIKPTNTLQYLERKRAHNPSVVFKGMFKGETIRHMKSTSDLDVLQGILKTFKTYLLKWVLVIMKQIKTYTWCKDRATLLYNRIYPLFLSTNTTLEFEK